MVIYRLKELVARKETSSGRRITLDEVAMATGIHRTTLSKIRNNRGYNSTTDNVEAMCRYLECNINELIEFDPPIGKRAPKKG